MRFRITLILLIFASLLGCTKEPEKAKDLPLKTGADPTTPGTWKLALAESFDAGRLPAGWTIIAGEPFFVKGAMVARGRPLSREASAPRGDFSVIMPTTLGEATRLEYDAWFDEDATFDEDSDLSAMLNATEQTPGYLVQFGGTGNTVSRIVRNGADLIVSTDPKLLIVPGKKHHVVIEHVGEIVTMQVDDAPVLRLRDLFPLAGGRAGLYSFGEGAHFDNVKLWTLEPHPAMPLAGADAKLMDRKPAEALALYEQFVAQHPDSPTAKLATLKAGRAMAQMGRLDDARTQFTSLLDTDLAGWARLQLADINLSGTDPQKIVDELVAAASGDPDAAALVRYSFIYLTLRAPRDHDAAFAAALLAGARNHLDDADFARLAGDLCGSGHAARASKSFATARRFYETVIEGAGGLDVRRADALCGLGLSWIECEEPDAAKAREAFMRVLRDFSEVTPAALMASVFTGSPAPDVADRAQALRAYKGLEKQFAIPGPRSWARLFAGIEQLALGRDSEAKIEWEHIVARIPDDDPRPTRLARFFLGIDDEKTFLAGLEKTPAPLLNDDLYIVGRFFEAKKEPDRAKEFYRRSLDASDDDDWPAPLARKKIQ